jgi:predicted ArsR family transcriptional regulator
MTNWLTRLLGDTQLRMLRLLRRERNTITGLAQELELTDNAIRTHVAALDRQGIVEQVGTRREARGKPGRVYGLTRDGEELFPKAYALVLGGLVEEVTRTEGRERALELLRAVGEKVGEAAPPARDLKGRVNAAAAQLRSLGGDVEVQRLDGAWKLQGYGCPLSAVTAAHPEVCALAQALVQEITGQPVTECCDRTDRPRCGFRIES